MIRTGRGPGLGGAGGRAAGAWPSRSSPAPDLKLTRSRREPLPRARSLPSPTPALPARGPARQSAPLHCRRGESDCRHHPPTPPTARLGEKSSKTFPFSFFLFFLSFFLFFFFFLFANTIYPRSKLGDEIWLVQSWLARTRGLPAIPSLVPRQPGLLTCPLDPSDTVPSATLCMTA